MYDYEKHPAVPILSRGGTAALWSAPIGRFIDVLTVFIAGGPSAMKTVTVTTHRQVSMTIYLTMY